jgi:DNA ligase D-like protein (predicted polymerase)
VQGRFVFIRPKDAERSAGTEDWLVQRRKETGAPAPRTDPRTHAPSVEVAGRRLKLSNLDKPLYPGVPKSAVVDYYARIADTLLPHLAGRPLTLRRFPDGIDRPSFYEKNAGRNAPDWLRTVDVPTPGSTKGSETANFVVVEELATLVYLANLAVLELHVPQWRVDAEGAVHPPDELVFDLDPGEGTTIVECAQVGCWLRDIFDHFEIRSFPKTSGSKGLQIYVPLNTPGIEYVNGGTKDFARACAELLEKQHPDAVVSSMSKERRQGKVFVDWSQNDEHKTTVCVYSLRAKERPTVSTPVTWDEVEAALAARDPQLLSFEAPEVIERFAEHGDLFAPVATLEQQLPKLG